MKKITSKLYRQLVLPIISSVDPVHQVAIGVAIGMFLGLTPTVGVQMYAAAILWAISRYLFRYRFNLPVSMAMVWISNPITFVPMYYVFLATGNALFSWWGIPFTELSFVVFEQRFAEISQQEGAWNVFVEGTRFLVIELGYPMMIGSLLYAIPGSIVSYFLTVRYLTRFRKYKAKQENLSYEEWRNRYESRN